MRNKFFKFNENYANVIKHLDDKQAGQYVKAISECHGERQRGQTIIVLIY